MNRLHGSHHRSLLFLFSFIPAFLVGGGAAAIAQPPTEVRVGFLPATHDALLFIAIEQSFFPSDIKVTLSQGSVSPDILNRMRSNTVDIGIPGVAAPAHYIGGGSPFVIVGGAAKKSAAVVVRKEHAAKFRGREGKDTIPLFKGMRIGSFKQSTGDAIFRASVSNMSVSLLDSYRTPKDLLNDLRGGRIDGAVLWSPHMSIVEEEGAGVVVLWLDKLIPDHVCCRQVVREDFLKDHEAAVVSYLQGLIKAMVFYMDEKNRDKVVAAVSKYVGKKEIVLRELYDTPEGPRRTTLSVDLDADGIKTYLSAMQKSQQLRDDEVDRVTKRIVAEPLQKAYEKLGLKPALARAAVTSGFDSVRTEFSRPESLRKKQDDTP